MSNNQVSVRLVSIQEKMFSLNLEDSSFQLSTSGPEVEFAHSLSIDKTQNDINLLFGVRYVKENNIILESRYNFLFHLDSLEDVVKFESDGFQIQDFLLINFISVAIGTMRGIIYLKTNGTLLSKYPLPIINPEGLLRIMRCNKSSK